MVGSGWPAGSVRPEARPRKRDSRQDAQPENDRSFQTASGTKGTPSFWVSLVIFRQGTSSAARRARHRPSLMPSFRTIQT